MKNWLALSALLIPAAISLSACAQTTGVPPAASSAQRAARPVVADARARTEALWAKIERSGFSGAVRIDMGDDIIIRAAAGFADASMQRPFTPDTQFEIGSLTKPFTAAAILKLQEQGKLSVRDPLSKFFPDLPADKADVTLHHLMTHSSGLPMGTVGGAMAANVDLEPINRASFIERAFRTPLDFAPGQRLGYSNSGYGLLAAVVEVVTGGDYETYLRSEILRPAGANRTGYMSALENDDAVHTADGRSIVECCWGEGGPYWNLLGNGGMMSTLDDFVSWRKAFARGQVVSAHSVVLAGTPWVPQNDGPGGEGYGWIAATSPTRGPVQLAAGGNAYFITEMRHYPEYDITTLVFSNGRTSAGEVASRLIQAMFGEPDLAQVQAGGSAGERRLINAFAEALLSPDPTVRRNFIEANAGPVFQQREGLEAIVTRFGVLHAELAGGSLGTVDGGGGGNAQVTFLSSTGARKVVGLTFGGTPDKPRIAGFSSE